MAAIAGEQRKSVVDVVVEIEKGGGAQMVSFGMSEEDVRIYMRRPWVATASDGSSKTPDRSVPHPRSYGTFPRKIGRYAIELRSLSHGTGTFSRSYLGHEPMPAQLAAKVKTESEKDE